MNDILSGLRILILEDEFLIALDVEQLCRDHGATDIIVERDLERTGNRTTHSTISMSRSST